MSESLFTPKITHSEDTKRSEPIATKDRLLQVLLATTQIGVIALLFLLPLFFTPGVQATLGFDKVLLALLLGLGIITSSSLMALRCRQTKTVIPLPLVVFWLFVVITFGASFFTNDILDASRGQFFSPQTAGFIALLGLLMTVPLVLQGSKKMALRAVLYFSISGAVLLVYSLLRIFFFPELFSLGTFQSVTTSPIGGFNDLAIFSALVVIVGLITLLQLPLKKLMQLVVSGLISVAVIILAIVNFFHLWLLIGFFALLVLVYILSRDSLFSDENKKSISPIIIITTIAICLISGAFIVAGEYVGNQISTVTDISFVEVRPSAEATLAITRAVYQENLFLGVGPNRFSDAWRLHKDRSINETLFWNTDFTAGYGYVPTLFITGGLLGGLAIVIFHLLYLYAGYRMLLRSESTDTFWYYFGVTTFVGATLLWIMSYLYVPGAAILLLTALFTGLSFVAYGALLPQSVITISLVSNRRRGFALMTIAIIVVSTAAGVLFTVGKQYVAQATFTQAQTATSVAEFELGVQEAWSLYQDDQFIGALAQVKLSLLQEALLIPEPNEEDQANFLTQAEQVIILAQTAIQSDPTNPQPYAILAAVYNTLKQAGLENADAPANEALNRAKELDPLNPVYAFISASEALRDNDISSARSAIADALALRRNFAEALFLLAQIDIQEGNVEAAVATARQITTIEPNNPTRFYQLGILLASSDDLPGAIRAYEAAIERDINFANARYLLALGYLETDRVDEALEQLRIVLQTNQGNEQLLSIINEIETTGGVDIAEVRLDDTVQEAEPVQEESAIVTTVNPDTDLITPVNTSGNSSTTE